MTDRVSLLRSLVALDRPASDIASELNAYGWDSEAELVILRRDHVRSVIGRYLRGDIDAAAVEYWADAIEGRDDIGFEPGWEAVLERVVHQLANPLLTERLSTRAALELDAQLSS